MTAILEQLRRREELSADQAESLLYTLAARDPSGAARTPLPDSTIGEILLALHSKGETPDELAGLARGMRTLARRPALSATAASALDIVGTGGDSSNIVNLSTGAALLAAAAGVPIVKHGNRSVSSRCGAADVLEALGLPMPLTELAAAACFVQTGFTFLFAPHYHPALGAIALIRRQLGVRTTFNILGPLTNPAQPPFAVIGAYALDVARLMAGAFAQLPIKRVFVIHAHNGWDEPTPVAPFTVFDVQPSSAPSRDPIIESVRSASDYGLPTCTPADLAGADAAFNASRLRSSLTGEQGPLRHALILGAAVALEVAGRAASPLQAAAMASAAIDDGRAATLLSRLASIGSVATAKQERPRA